MKTYVLCGTLKILHCTMAVSIGLKLKLFTVDRKGRLRKSETFLSGAINNNKRHEKATTGRADILSFYIDLHQIISDFVTSASPNE